MTDAAIRKMAEEIGDRIRERTEGYVLEDGEIEAIIRRHLSQPDAGGDIKRAVLTDEQSRFIVRVMDCIRENPLLLEGDLIAVRKRLDVLYDKHGRFMEGSIGGRAEWLIEHLASIGGKP